MIEIIIRRRQECLRRLTLLTESLRERLTPETEVSEDLRHQIRKLKKYSDDLFYADIKFRVEDVDNDTKEKAKKETFKAMRAADEILFPKDPRLEALIESLENGDFTDNENYIQESDESDDEAIAEIDEFEDHKNGGYDPERVIVKVMENNLRG